MVLINQNLATGHTLLPGCHWIVSLVHILACVILSWLPVLDLTSVHYILSFPPVWQSLSLFHFPSPFFLLSYFYSFDVLSLTILRAFRYYSSTFTSSFDLILGLQLTVSSAHHQFFGLHFSNHHLVGWSQSSSRLHRRSQQVLACSKQLLCILDTWRTDWLDMTSLAHTYFLMYPIQVPQQFSALNVVVEKSDEALIVFLL